ncbi:MAG TPA: hypothetical protein VGN07_06455 [Steroidobacteraceae bacterium]|jgi:hypothetical protein
MNRARITMFRKFSLLFLVSLLFAAPLYAQEQVAAAVAAQAATSAATVPTGATAAPSENAAGSTAAPGGEFKSLDQEVQSLKKEVLDLNRELFVLEEDLLFPANTQVAVFVSMDVGDFFALDSVTLKLDNKEVANYLYTEREAQALLKGAVQRVFIGNLKAGDHELVALFTGQGPHTRDYRRGATLKLQKGVGAKYVELKISDRASKAQPEFVVKEWE